MINYDFFTGIIHHSLCFPFSIFKVDDDDDDDDEFDENEDGAEADAD